MSSAVAGKINSHNEWDKLREIIVGTAGGSMAVLTWNRPEPIPENVKEQAYKIAKNAFPKWFLDEIAEDLEGLANLLKGFGVKVHRPTVKLPYFRDETERVLTRSSMRSERVFC